MGDERQRCVTRIHHRTIDRLTSDSDIVARDIAVNNASHSSFIMYRLVLSSPLLVAVHPIRKTKEAAKTAAAGPVVKALTHAQIQEKNANAMRAKQLAKDATK